MVQMDPKSIGRPVSVRQPITFNRDGVAYYVEEYTGKLLGWTDGRLDCGIVASPSLLACIEKENGSIALASCTSIRFSDATGFIP